MTPSDHAPGLASESAPETVGTPLASSDAHPDATPKAAAGCLQAGGTSIAGYSVLLGVSALWGPRPNSVPKGDVAAMLSSLVLASVLLLTGAGLMARRKWGALLLVLCCSVVWLGTVSLATMGPEPSVAAGTFWATLAVLPALIVPVAWKALRWK